MGYGRSRSPLSKRSTRRWICYAAATVAALIFLFILLPLPEQYEDPRNSIIHHVAEVTTEHIPDAIKPARFRPASLETTKSKYAYATFLASGSGPGEEINTDKYFVATRLLAYQLIHAPETKSPNDYPFLVLVTSDVSKAKRERLRKDGAIVWEPEAIDPKWVKTEITTWQYVLAKLRLFEIVQFERICFLDGDTVLTKPLDDIFHDPAVETQRTGDSLEAVRDDEYQQPAQYGFAGVPEMNLIHHFPPTEEGHDWPNFGYLNAGLFVLQPSLELLKYYLSLLDTPNRFNADLPEQNLLNYAHRPNGNLPWQHLSTKWNMHYPTVDDVKGGVYSLHEKWWDPVYPDLRPLLESWRWRMEGFHEARDAYMVKHGLR